MTAALRVILAGRRVLLVRKGLSAHRENLAPPERMDYKGLLVPRARKGRQDLKVPRVRMALPALPGLPVLRENRGLPDPRENRVQ